MYYKRKIWILRTNIPQISAQNFIISDVPHPSLTFSPLIHMSQLVTSKFNRIQTQLNSCNERSFSSFQNEQIWNRIRRMESNSVFAVGSSHEKDLLAEEIRSGTKLTSNCWSSNFCLDVWFNFLPSSEVTSVVRFFKFQRISDHETYETEWNMEWCFWNNL